MEFSENGWGLEASVLYVSEQIVWTRVWQQLLIMMLLIPDVKQASKCMYKRHLVVESLVPCLRISLDGCMQKSGQ
jgi:hypothetical protein